MKKTIKVIGLFLALSFLPLAMSAQNPPHPNGGSGPGSGNTPVGGGAPIDGGLAILIALGAGYAARRTFSLKKAE